MARNFLYDFINFCQNQEITLKEDNILSLHKLSKKYNVKELIKSTESYILSHPKKFIIQFLALIQDQPDSNKTQYEDIISMNLPDFIQDDLLSLPIKTIYRIVTKYQLKPGDNNKIIEFLFKCLDKYGREASALFEKVDLIQLDTIYLKKLINEYSQILDFRYINSEKFIQQFVALSEIINQQNNLISSLKEQINYLRKPRISCNFKGEHDTKGIVYFLSKNVKIRAGGRHDPKHKLENIMNNSNDPESYFFNYYEIGYKSNTKDDSWIILDFGQKIKIELNSYYIRSNGNDASHHFHPKSWRIEGSNNEIDWVLLDKRENEDALNGPDKQSKFECNENKSDTGMYLFRYIRYFQDDCWCHENTVDSQNPYNVYIKYFELYGDIYQFE